MPSFAVTVVLTGTWLLLVFDPELQLVDALFEMTSAFGTVGLSTGITTSLSVPSKLVSILIMYIGRLGPLTIASVRYFNKGERIRYPEGNSPSADRRNNMFGKSKKAKASYGIVGLGRFGLALAIELAEAGEDLVVLDQDEEKVRVMRDYTESAYVVKALTKDPGGNRHPEL